MNSFLNFQLRLDLMRSNLAIQIFLCFVLLAVAIPRSSAQKVLCKEEPPTFSGVPEQTLCEKFPNFSCSIQIGTGTQFPKSSLIGASLSGNVCIIGNFEVDVPFTFQNAVVKITPGVTIAVKPSPNDYDSGSTLIIDNSKLFACEGLWKGITVGHLSSISTQNNTEIEDAETAILATGLCALFIQQTRFNRDRVGIELNTPFPSVVLPGPLVYVFSNNSFYCDAPLNGTTNEITYAGVKLKDSYLYTYQPGNSFRDIIYGIHATGNSTHIGAGNLMMNRIKKDGIFMTHGSLDLKNSDFFNTEEKSVNIEFAKTVRISATKFLFTASVLPPNPTLHRTGIYIEKFDISSSVQIYGMTFTGDLDNNESYIRGVHLKGTEVGEGTKIYIGGNSVFSFRAKNSTGIFLDGHSQKPA